MPNASGTLAVSASGNLALSASGNLTITNSPNFSTSVTTPQINGSGGLAIAPGGTLLAGATNQIFTLQGNGSSTITSSSGGFKTTVGFTSPTATRNINFPDAGGTICTDSGNCLGGGSGGANTALSNLTSVAINTSLLPGSSSGVNLGSAVLPFGQLYIGGSSSTPAVNNFLLTGSSTGGTRTITLPDASGTICLQTASSCGFAANSGDGNYILNQAGTQQTSANIDIQSTGGHVALAVQGASGQDIADIYGSASNVVPVAKFDSSGNFTAGTINSANISGGTLSAGSVTGGSLTGGTFTSTTADGLGISATNITAAGGLTVSTGGSNPLTLTSGSGNIITGSTINGDTLSATSAIFPGAVAIQGSSALTLGTGSTNNGAIIFKNSTNNNTLTLQSGVSGSNFSLTLPTNIGSPGQCLTSDGVTGALSFANCLTGGGGGSSGVASLDGLSGTLNINNSSGAGSTITIANAAADGATKGIATFNATNFSAASGVINTIQGISSAASPTFVGLTLSGAITGATTVDGATLSGGTLSGGTYTSTTADGLGVSATNITAAGALTVSTGGTNTLTLDTGTLGGIVNIGHANAATVNIGGAAASTVNLGTSAASIVNLGSGVTTGAINVGALDTTGLLKIGGTSETGTLTVGQSTLTNTIAIGAGASGATTVQIANASATDVVSVGSALTSGTITIGGSSQTGNTVLQARGLTDTLTGSASAPSDTIQSSINSATAFQIQDAAGTDQIQVDSLNGGVTLSNGTTGTAGTLASSWSNTTPLSQALADATSVVYNGYIYEIGGQNSGGTQQKTVYYAPIKANGSLGAWTSNTNQLPEITESATSVVYDGYIYVIGGNSSTGGGDTSNVYYAPINADGSVGAWAASSSLPLADTNAAAVVYNGVIFEIGGNTTGGGPWTTVYSAPIGANGVLGNWSANTSLPQGINQTSAVVYNGYIYEEIGGLSAGGPNHVYSSQIGFAGILGAWNSINTSATTPFANTAVVYNGNILQLGGVSSGSATTEVDYTSINGAGTVNSWATTTPLSQALEYATSVAYNGYVYELGGATNSGVAQSTVYYASIFNNNQSSLAVNGAGTTVGDTLNSTNAFQIQNAAGADLFQVDTAGNNIYLGGSTSSTINIGSVGVAPYTTNINIGTSPSAAQAINVGNTSNASVSLQTGGANLNLGASNGNIILTTTNFGGYGTIVKPGFVNETTAFEVQNVSGTPLLQVDTATSGGIVNLAGTVNGQTVNIGAVGAAAITNSVNIGTTSGANQTITIGNTGGASSLSASCHWQLNYNHRRKYREYQSKSPPMLHLAP